MRLMMAESGVTGEGGAVDKPKSGMLNALYKFTRPHTIRGTILASCACVTRVMIKCIQTQPVIEWKLLQTAMYGLVALLCGNAYIVGINQVPSAKKIAPHRLGAFWAAFAYFSRECFPIANVRYNAI